jgi:hypothetical protein
VYSDTRVVRLLTNVGKPPGTQLKDLLGPLSAEWRALTEEQQAAYYAEAERVNNLEDADELDEDIDPDTAATTPAAARTYKDLKKLMKEICDHPDLRKHGLNLLVLGCAPEDESFVVTSSAAVRSYFDKRMAPAHGRMTMADIEKYAAPGNNAREVVNEAMSKDNVGMNIRSYFWTLYSKYLDLEQLCTDFHGCR